MTTAAEAVLAAARRLADDVLFPDAMRVDRLDVLPTAHLDALAAHDLFGAPAPCEVGGLGLDLRELSAVVEEVAGGCLATAFVWIQHFGLVMTLAAAGAQRLSGTGGSRPPAGAPCAAGSRSPGWCPGPRCCAPGPSAEAGAWTARLPG
jgi:alkylation response protein AidB-like acyl-CoA dehydrogenase